MREVFRLDDKIAIVTGASRGIGEACARALAGAGARVGLVARSQEKLERLAAELAGEPVIFEQDLGQSGAAAVLVERVLHQLGGADVLVNNAGISQGGRSHKLTEERVEEVINVNVRSLLLMSTGLAPSMAERGGGSIINVSSTSGRRGTPFQSAYAATKGAVDALTRSLAAEWGPFGIRVNSIAPGLIITDMWEQGRKVPGMIEDLQNHVPLRRWGEPDDIADVALFLATPASRYVTGQTLVVDGGMTNAFDPRVSAEAAFQG